MSIFNYLDATPLFYPERWNRRDREVLEKEDARDLVENMLQRSRNPNLKVGEIQEKEEFFVVQIMTRDGSLVDEMQVDRETGMMRSIY